MRRRGFLRATDWRESRRPPVLFLVAALWMLALCWQGAWARKGTDGKTARSAEVGAAPAGTSVKIALLTQVRPERIRPYFDLPITDAGIAGAQLATIDNNTTGQFTRQTFTLTEVRLEAGADVRPAFEHLIADGHRLILLDLPAETLGKLAAMAGSDTALLFDIGSRDDELRGSGCAANVLHMLPSRAMLADALGQYLLAKRWTKWLLVSGSGQGDQAFASALRRAAKRFGGKIVADKAWDYRFDDRRTPESTVPVFTQGDDYDVLVVADEEGAFGDMLSYRTWLARPVAGTQGLVTTGWHPTHEAWGALQLQNRFRERSGRWMSELDYGAWLAVRAIGEAATRTRSSDFTAVRDYLLSEQFTLAGFKGVPLSFRRWDHQLRQPVLLAHPRSLVAVAPVEGVIHPKNELDTLGYDESESACRSAL